MNNFCVGCGNQMVGRFCGNCGTGAALAGVPVAVAPTYAIPAKSYLISPSLHWFLCFIFQFLSFGIFGYVLTYTQTRYIEDFDAEAGRKIRSWFFALMALQVAGILFLFSGNYGMHVFLMFVGGILFAVMAFKMTRPIEAMYRARNVNREYARTGLAVLFTIFYTQYQFNQIAKLDRGQI